MFIKLLNIMRAPEAGDASGGAPQVSTSQPVDTQASVVATPNSGDNGGTPSPTEKQYTSETFESWEKMSRADLDAAGVTDEDTQKYAEWAANGRKKTPTPSSDPSTGKDSVQTQTKAPAEVPKGDSVEQAQKILSEKSANRLTDQDIVVIEAAMAKVGAKTPQELLSKQDGLLALAGKKGQEAGDLQNQLDQFTAFFDDLVAGKPEAIEHLRKHNPRITLAEAQAKIGEQIDATKAALDKLPEGVIDEVTYKEVGSLKAAIQELREENKKLLQSFTEKETASKEEFRLAQTRNDYIDQGLQLAVDFPEAFKVESGNLKQLLLKHFYEGVTDPRLGNFIEVAKFAMENQLYDPKTGNLDLKRAHILRDYEMGGPAKRLAAAKQQGMEEVARQGRSQGFASVRDSAAASSPTVFTPADVALMNDGKKDAPLEWFTNGMLDKKKVPQNLHQYIWKR